MGEKQQVLINDYKTEIVIGLAAPLPGIRGKLSPSTMGWSAGPNSFGGGTVCKQSSRDLRVMTEDRGFGDCGVDERDG